MLDLILVQNMSNHMPDSRSRFCGLVFAFFVRISYMYNYIVSPLDPNQLVKLGRQQCQILRIIVGHTDIKLISSSGSDDPCNLFFWTRFGKAMKDRVRQMFSIVRATVSICHKTKYPKRHEKTEFLRYVANSKQKG
eukprot:Nitzschia sp. Nitz4//scaffold19_size178191//175300//175707//NITZ4_002019-RA/size178191-exonerate_est2genome-gene-0.349-mRNA-1//-1//CDS//3329540807//5375//frame0